jgi:hypothetical protein
MKSGNVSTVRGFSKQQLAPSSRARFMSAGSSGPLRAHKYFICEIDAQGQLKWSRKAELIQREEQIDGWFLLHTNHSVQESSAQQTLGHYKGLLEVEEAFCQLCRTP